MKNFKEVEREIAMMAYSIMDIACPIIGICDEECEKQIFDTLEKKYGINFEGSGIDMYSPLAMLSLYIICNKTIE